MSFWLASCLTCANLAFHVIFGTSLLVGALTRREWYHKTLVVFGIVALFARLH
jgi:hypothetical protein